MRHLEREPNVATFAAWLMAQPAHANLGRNPLKPFLRATRGGYWYFTLDGCVRRVESEGAAQTSSGTPYAVPPWMERYILLRLGQPFPTRFEHVPQGEALALLRELDPLAVVEAEAQADQGAGWLAATVSTLPERYRPVPVRAGSGSSASSTGGFAGSGPADDLVRGGGISQEQEQERQQSHPTELFPVGA